MLEDEVDVTRSKYAELSTDIAKTRGSIVHADLNEAELRRELASVEEAIALEEEQISAGRQEMESFYAEDFEAIVLAESGPLDACSSETRKGGRVVSLTSAALQTVGSLHNIEQYKTLSEQIQLQHTNEQ